MTLVKTSMNIDEKVLAKVQSYADSIGVNRTAAFTFLVTQGLMAVATPELLEKISEALKDDKR